MKRGGAKLELINGRIILILEEKNLPVALYYPMCKEILKGLRSIDMINCFEKYSLKDSLEVEDVDFSEELKQVNVT